MYCHFNFLFADKNIMAKSGGILITQDLGDEYGFADIDGNGAFNIGPY